MPRLGLSINDKLMIYSSCSWVVPRPGSKHITHLAARKRRRRSRWRSEATWTQTEADGLPRCSGSARPGYAGAERSWCPPRGWQRRCTPTPPGRTAPARRICWACLRICAWGFPLNSPDSACWNPPRSRVREWWWWPTRPSLHAVDESIHTVQLHLIKCIYSHRHVSDCRNPVKTLAKTFAMFPNPGYFSLCMEP